MANQNKVKGKIESVEVIKSGTTKNRKWTLYRVTIDGEEYTTFDGRYQKLIEKEGEWEFEIQEREGKDGVVFENKVLPRLPEEKKESKKEEDTETIEFIKKGMSYIRGDIKKVDDKVGELLGIWKKIEDSDKVVLYPKKKPESSEEEEDIPEEDIPF